MPCPSRVPLQIASRNSFKRLAVFFILAGVSLYWCHCSMIKMPGKSHSGPLPALTDDQATLAEELRRDVDMLAGIIGKRNVFFPKALVKAEAFLTTSLTVMGYDVRRQEFETHHHTVANLEVEIKGSKNPEEIVVIGAHYDSCDFSPAANDNGSGVAATLALAQRFAIVLGDTTGTASLALRTGSGRPGRTIRFVLFVNEEPPFFQTEQMGSLVYARRCQERGENITAMLSLETIGYYTDAPGSQKYPLSMLGWFYPDTGNFISFVGNFGSRKLVRQCIANFRANTQFPSEGGAVPGNISGVGWSDHWAFWQCGYPGVMVTDTAPYRYPFYHSDQDTPDKLDYEKLARVVEGLEKVVQELVGE